MIHRLRRWLAAPVFPDAEAKSYRASILNYALNILLFTVPVAIAGNLIGGRTPWEVSAVDALLVVLVLLARFLMRRGRVQMASIMLAVAALFTVAAAVVALGTIRTPVAMGFGVLVVGFGLLFDLRGLVVGIVLSSLTILGLIGAENAGWLPRPDYTLTVTQWVTFTALLVAQGGLTFLALRSTRQALAERQQAAAQLRQSEARLQSVLATMGDGVLVQDARGVITACNAGAERLLGRPADQIVGQGCATLCVGAIRADGSPLPHDEHPASITLRTGEPQQSAPIGIERPGGECSWLLLNTQPIRASGSDALQSVVTTLTDVNAQVRREHAVEKERERYVRLMRVAHDAIHVIDRQGRLREWNDAFLSQLGYTADEARALTVADWDVRWSGAELIEQVNRSMDHPSTFETRHRRKDGGIRDVEITATGLTWDGEQLLYASARDITERKRLERELQRERDFALAVVNTMGQGLTATDADARIEYVNPAYARFIGYAPDEIIGKCPVDFAAPGDAGMLAQARADRMQGKTTSYEARYRRRDGAIVTALVTGVPRWRDGQYAGAIAVVTDLTERKRLEQELEKQRDFALMVVNNMGEGLAVTDARAAYEFVNPAMARLLGCAPADVIGKQPSDFVASGSMAMHAQLRADLAAGGTATHEINYRRGDGGILQAQVTGVPRFVDGQFAGAISVVTDLSERKRMEQELERQRDFAIAVINAMGQGVAVLDREGRFEFVNPACERLLGYPRAAFPGQPLAAMLHSADRRALADVLAAWRAGREATCEVRCVRADGSLVPVLLGGAPRHAAGASTGAIAVLTDLTERKRSEDALRESEARYRQMFTEHSAVMLVLDPETGAIVDANPAASRFYGYLLDRLHTMNMKDINVLAAAELDQSMQHAKSGLLRHLFVRQRMASGAERDVEVYTTPVRSGGRNLLYTIVHDVTERKQLERELEVQFHFATSVLNTIGQGLTVTNAQGCFEYVNPAFVRTVGRSPEEIIGKRQADIAAPDYEQERAQAASDRRRGKITTCPAVYLHRDGRRVEVQITGVPRWNGKEYGGSVAVISDMTEQNRLKQALQAQRDFAMTVVNTMGQGLFVTDREGRIEFANAACARMLGYAPESFSGQWPDELVAPADRERLVAARAARMAGQPSTYELCFVCADGRLLPAQIVAVPRDPQGGAAGAIAVITDLTERKQTEDQLRYISTHDALTGVYSRSFLEAELERLATSRDFPISILVADLDNMKTTNDRLGHAAGDELLRRAARVLQSAFRASDILARMGGDEFVLVLPETDAECAAQVMGRIRENVALANRAQAGVPLSLSLGTATAMHGDLQEALKLADARMYEDKRARKETPGL
ncbi:MAG: PAS domain S-box protein [Chloroflexi bacterium]|nr:PAS domain S-box protein [Chloroflexota bacterium]